MNRKRLSAHLAAIVAAALTIVFCHLRRAPPRSAPRHPIFTEPTPTVRPKASTNTTASTWCWSGTTTIALTP